MQEKLTSTHGETPITGGSQRRKNAFLGLFDLPLFKDWIAWLAVIAVIAGINSVVGTYQRSVLVGGFPVGGTAFSIEGEELAFLIDCLFSAAFQVGLFALLPAFIRKSVRQRKQA